MRAAHVVILAPLVLATLAVAGLPVRAETAKPPAEEAGEAAPTPEELGYIPVALNVAGVDYAAEVTPAEFDGPSDLRLRRLDGATMADQTYLLAELGAEACHQAGYEFDPGVPPMLGTDGSWTITGGCR